MHKDLDVRIFLKECVSLAQAFPDYEVHLILPGVVERVEQGVWVHSVPKHQGSRLQRMWHTVNKIYKKALGLDACIYHLHDPELLRIATKLKRKGKKVMYDAHEDLPRQMLGKSYLPMKKWASYVFEWYENFVVRKLDGVVTATPFIRDRFSTINPNVLDINNFPLLSEIEFSNEVVGSKNHICYIGGVTPIRGISELVSAMAQTDVTLELAGSIQADFLSILETNPGWKGVLAHGHVSREESAKIRQRAFAGVVTFLPYPNHINAQPNKIFEYMASGIPVIGSHFPLWRVLIEDNRVGVCVDPNNPQSIAAAILYLKNNPDMAQEMGAVGKRLVREKYNWDIEAQKLIVFYQKLMDK